MGSSQGSLSSCWSVGDTTRQPLYLCGLSVSQDSVRARTVEDVLRYQGSRGPWPTRGEDSFRRLLVGKKKLLCHPNTETPVLHKQIHLVNCQLQLAHREVRDEIPDDEVFPAVVERSFHGNRRHDVIDR